MELRQSPAVPERRGMTAIPPLESTLDAPTELADRRVRERTLFVHQLVDAGDLRQYFLTGAIGAHSVRPAALAA